jgi:hypothetical protein
MAQITSREELVGWLKDKPDDWAQAIVARAALRALPYAFGLGVKLYWIDTFALSLLRALAISWAATNFPAPNTVSGSYFIDAAVRANVAANAAVSANAAVRANAAASTLADVDAYPAAHAAEEASFAAIRPNDAPFAAYAAARAADAYSAWADLNRDCDWLAGKGHREQAARLLTYEPLWSAGASYGWKRTRLFATTQLLALDPTYQVWIDWYNRRIEGHDAAFDIPGDIDRVHDKAILVRLADASDEDFWGKGATYVNTTLQRWIDEARLAAYLESF